MLLKRNLENCLREYWEGEKHPLNLILVVTFKIFFNIYMPKHVCVNLNWSL